MVAAATSHESPVRRRLWRVVTVSLSITAVAAALVPLQTSAAPCPPAYQYRVDTGGAGPASVPVHDTSFPLVPGRSRAYFTQGTLLVSVHNRNYPIGCIGTALADPCAANGTCSKFRGCRQAGWSAPSTLSAAPRLVSSSQDTSKASLFIGADNGLLYKIDVTGEPPFPTLATVDTRRASCTTDKIIATPAVQLYASANTAFRNRVDSFGASHTGDDVIFVTTSTGCGDQTRNRVIAYFASDLSPMWVFNAPGLPGGELRVGAGTEGCSVDYSNNRLFCGTAAPPGSDQDSLWAIDTLTGRLSGRTIRAAPS